MTFGRRNLDIECTLMSSNSWTSQCRRTLGPCAIFTAAFWTSSARLCPRTHGRHNNRWLMRPCLTFAAAILTSSARLCLVDAPGLDAPTSRLCGRRASIHLPGAMWETNARPSPSGGVGHEPPSISRRRCGRRASIYLPGAMWETNARPSPSGGVGHVPPSISRRRCGRRASIHLPAAMWETSTRRCQARPPGDAVSDVVFDTVSATLSPTSSRRRIGGLRRRRLRHRLRTWMSQCRWIMRPCMTFTAAFWTSSARLCPRTHGRHNPGW